jgi:hypothetical protein
VTDSGPTSPHRGVNPTAGPIGGASGDAGVEFRRAVAAYAVVHALAGEPLAGLGFPLELSHVASVAIETDEHADDVRVRLTSGHLVQIQAKSTLRGGKPLETAIDQWSRAAKAGLDPVHDRLVIVAGTVSGPMQLLARVLDRLRTDEPGALTRSEQEQLDKITALTPELSGQQREAMIRCGVITQLDVVEEHSPIVASARTLLRQVVEATQTVKAWRVLVHHAGRVGRLRGGFSVEGWVRLLEQDGIEVVSGPTPAREAALTAQALDLYRQQIRRRGTHIDLRPLGNDIPPIPLAEMDAEVACSPSNDSRDKEPLAWSLLRRRRVLLTGLPGGGKSTAVAAAGAVLVDAAGSPVPVVVSLRDVTNRHAIDSLADRILDTAVRDLPPPHRGLVRATLEAGLQTGETALLLDSLDETHSRRGHVVAEIAELCEHMHAAVPVLLATRDVAYAPAHTLGWDDLRLCKPNKAESAVRTVLAATAVARGLKESTWVQTRVDWVMRVVRADSAIGQTPLMPVLLAMLAAARENQMLPNSRAAILHTVVEDLVRRRERERELIREMTGLTLMAAVAAVQAAFCLEAGVIAEHDGKAPVSTIRARLATSLMDDWGLSPGAAGSGATSIMHFWDEAGVFVIDGSGTHVAPRIELFLDIGDAVLICRSSKIEVKAWVHDRIASGRHEPVVLAAGLNADAAAALVEEACASDGYKVLHAAVEAIRQHAEIDPTQMDALCIALERDARQADREGWRSFRALLALREPRTPAELEQLLDAYPPGLRMLGLAAAGRRAEEAGLISGEDLDALQLPLLDMAKMERLSPREGQKTGFQATPTGNDVIEAAAERLLKRIDGVAPRIANLLDKISFGSSRRLEDALRATGHGDLVTAVNADRLQSFRSAMAWMADFDKDAPERLLEHLAAGPQAQLTHAQSSDLEELADLYHRLGLNSVGSWPRKSVSPAWWFEFIETVIRLGGFDSAVISAQARLTQERVHKFGMDAFYALDIAARLRPLNRWTEITEPESAVELLLDGLFKGPDTAHTAAAALSNAPRDLVEEPLAAAVRQLSGHRKHQRWAAMALAIIQGEQVLERWATDDMVTCRLIAAESLPARDSLGRLNPRLKTLAFDIDREVAKAAVQNLSSTTDASEVAEDVAPFLRQVAEFTRGDWDCIHCGRRNHASANSCSECHIVPPDPVGAAAAALAALLDANPSSSH